MTLQLSQEQFTLEGAEVSSLEGPSHTPPNSSHEYELNQSESLTFLYNLLYDSSSGLSKSDILNILNSLQRRECGLPFAFDTTYTQNGQDIQGIKWPRGLKEKFKTERHRVGNANWFQNIPDSREKAFKYNREVRVTSLTDFYLFHRFFTKLKLHITHFQLRNLVCCGSNINKGIYYPLSYSLDSGIQSFDPNSGMDYQSYFKINRLIPNEGSSSLDCLIDSRNLLYNSNSRISTLTCSNRLLASGTFEGGYILQDISDSDSPRLVGEYTVSGNADGITNHIIINEDKELIVASNDKTLRLIDLNKRGSTIYDLSFAANCMSISHHNPNEIFVVGDHTSCFILDRRTARVKSEFAGHEDFGFSCDWSPSNENLLVSGNQDGSVKLWDRRSQGKCLLSWDGSLGSTPNGLGGGPVRNTKFSYNGNAVCWAESLDHIGLVPVDDTSEEGFGSKVQSIDFIGKCIGMNFVPDESGYGEQLIIGVSDCPLGGVLSYKLESGCKILDFDFHF